MLEIGKIYKTREGLKVKVINNKSKTLYPFLQVSVQTLDGSNSFSTFENGMFFNNGREHKYDIISHADGSPLN